MIPLMIFPADPADEAQLARIAEHLRSGGLLACPTETIYGLSASADSRGVDSVRAMKGRRDEHPFLVLLPQGLTPASRMDPGGLVWPEVAVRLAEAFWPGPLTLVLPDPEHAFPPGIRNGNGGVAVRVSSHPFIQALMRVWNRPLISTSANQAGEPVGQGADQVRNALEGRPGTYRLWIADGGELAVSPPSTIVDCTGEQARILREGAIGADRLNPVLKRDIHDRG